MKLTTAQAIVKYLIAQRTTIDGARGAAVPGRVRDLRARQRDLPRAGARGGARRAADVARPERAGDGARRGRLRQGDAPAPDHDRHVVDRTRRHQHGHRRRRRPLQPAAAAAHVGRHVPQPDPRPGAAAGRALPRPVDVGQRRLQGRSPATGTASPAPSRSCTRCRTRWRRCSTRPPADPCSSACRRTPRPRRSSTPTSSSTSSCTRSPRPRADRRQIEQRRGGDPFRRAAADHLRRRRALLVCRVGAAGFRRALPHPGRRDRRRQGDAGRRPSAQRRSGRSDRVPVGERTRRRGRRRDRGRLAAAGLHDRFVDRVPTLGAVRRHQHRRVRRHQALEHAGDRRRARDARRADAVARRLGGAGGLGRPRRPRDARLPRLHRQDRGTHGRHRADLRPGDRRRRPRRAADRLRRLRRRRAARRARQQLASEGREQLRLRVRVLVHGLRDLGCMGRQDGDARPRGDRVPRRRLVPDDELRPLLVGAHRATS